jgi:aldehyde dehydrogenase (NAD+)/gamma-glutamyl-gamma-aminobutyraldehyde dehydrogenase
MRAQNFYQEEYRNNNQKGFFAKPTLFDGLKEKMTIAQEEIFGPVLGVLTVKDDE